MHFPTRAVTLRTPLASWRNTSNGEFAMHLHRPASMSTLLLLLVLCGCSQTPAGTATPPSADETTGSFYFTSPEASVPVISELMTKKDWAALTRYYALTPDDPAR